MAYAPYEKFWRPYGFERNCVLSTESEALRPRTTPKMPRYSIHLAEHICRIRQLANQAEALAASPGTRLEELEGIFRQINTLSTNALVETLLESYP